MTNAELDEMIGFFQAIGFQTATVGFDDKSEDPFETEEEEEELELEEEDEEEEDYTDDPDEDEDE